MTVDWLPHTYWSAERVLKTEHSMLSCTGVRLRQVCPCSAALGSNSGSSLNSPQAKEVVLNALQAAGKEAGLKVCLLPSILAMPKYREYTGCSRCRHRYCKTSAQRRAA